MIFKFKFCASPVQFTSIREFLITLVFQDAVCKFVSYWISYEYIKVTVSNQDSFHLLLEKSEKNKTKQNNKNNNINNDVENMAN